MAVTTKRTWKNSGIDTNIPGLTVEWIMVASHLYANIVHIKSGKIIKSFKNSPIVGGKKKFIEYVNKSELKTFDWTVTENELLKSSKERMNAILNMNIK